MNVGMNKFQWIFFFKSGNSIVIKRLLDIKKKLGSQKTITHIDRHSNWSSNSINNGHTHDRTLQVLYKHFIKALKLISTIQIKSENSFIKKPSLHIDLNIKTRECRNNIFRWIMCRTTLGRSVIKDFW